MKQKYESPTCEIIYLDMNDILTTSPGIDQGEVDMQSLGWQ